MIAWRAALRHNGCVYKISVTAFFLLLATALVIEGVGIWGSRSIIPFLLVSAPFFLISIDVFYNYQYSLPKQVILLGSFFLLGTLLSLLSSVNLSQSLHYTLYYISLFLFFIYAYNHQNDIRKFIQPFTIILGFLFAISSMLLWIVWEIAHLDLFPKDGYQFIYNRWSSHHHLADFLLLFFAPFFFMLMKEVAKKRDIVVFLIFLPFFIFSYSRSAYLSLFLIFIVLFIIFWQRLMKKNLYAMIAGVFSIVLFFLFIATTIETHTFKPFRPVHEFLTTNYNLKYKTFLSKRDIYFSNSLQAIIDNPLGYGPGNYLYASAIYTNDEKDRTETSHNIFLDIFVENGVLAGVSIVLLFCWFLYAGVKTRPDYFAMIALMVNFQTDYTYRIFSFLLLFMVIAACLIPRSHNEEQGSRTIVLIPWILSGLLWIIAQAILVMTFLM